MLSGIGDGLADVMGHALNFLSLNLDQGMKIYASVRKVSSTSTERGRKGLENPTKFSCQTTARSQKRLFIVLGLTNLLRVRKTVSRVGGNKRAERTEALSKL